MLRNPDVPDCGWVEGRDRWWQDEIPGQSSDCAVEWVGPGFSMILAALELSPGDRMLPLVHRCSCIGAVAYLSSAHCQKRGQLP